MDVSEKELNWHLSIKAEYVCLPLVRVSRHGRGSNGIQLMTKLIEGLTPAGADKPRSSFCIYCMCVFCMLAWACVVRLDS